MWDYDEEEDDTMELVIWSLVAVGVFILLVTSCCCCKNNRGRVLQPPPDPNVSGAPYPQQQFSVAVPTATLITHNVTSTYPAAAPAPYTHAGAPYPTATPYPTASAYPNAGAPYPTAGAPYTNPGAPYPAVAPYPGAFPGAMPQPSGPTAPDVNALPPTYDQVMGGDKSSPYNPHAPH